MCYYHGARQGIPFAPKNECPSKAGTNATHILGSPPRRRRLQNNSYTMAKSKVGDVADFDLLDLTWTSHNVHAMIERPLPSPRIGQSEVASVSPNHLEQYSAAIVLQTSHR